MIEQNRKRSEQILRNTLKRNPEIIAIKMPEIILTPKIYSLDEIPSVSNIIYKRVYYEPPPLLKPSNFEVRGKTFEEIAACVQPLLEEKGYSVILPKTIATFIINHKYNKLEFNINVFPTNEIDDNGFNVFIIEFVRSIGDGIIMSNCFFDIQEKLTGIDHRRKPYIYVNEDNIDCKYDYDSLQ